MIANKLIYLVDGTSTAAHFRVTFEALGLIENTDYVIGSAEEAEKILIGERGKRLVDTAELLLITGPMRANMPATIQFARKVKGANMHAEVWFWERLAPLKGDLDPIFNGSLKGTGVDVVRDKVAEFCAVAV